MFVRVIGLFVLLATASASASGQYIDRVRTVTGSLISGRIQAMTANSVTISTSSKETEIPTNEIAWIGYQTEPTEVLDEVRLALQKGMHREVPELLDRIKPDQVRRDEVRGEIDFYRLLAAARAAAESVRPDSASLAAAGKPLLDFIKSQPDSYHIYQAQEAVGDLLAASDRSERAAAYYDALAAAPWPDYKIRALLLKGRLEQQQNKPDAALRWFDAALAIPAETRLAEFQAQLVRVAKAKSLAEMAKLAEAQALLDSVIAGSEPSDKEILARAYAALGELLLKKGSRKEATEAFLHVDLLYSAHADSHALALARLSRLWAEEWKRPDRAKASAELLKSRYPHSKWNSG